MLPFGKIFAVAAAQAGAQEVASLVIPRSKDYLSLVDEEPQGGLNLKLCRCHGVDLPLFRLVRTDVRLGIDDVCGGTCGRIDAIVS